MPTKKFIFELLLQIFVGAVLVPLAATALFLGAAGAAFVLFLLGFIAFVI